MNIIRKKLSLLLICLFPLCINAEKSFFNDLKTYWKDNVELWKASWNNRKEVSAITASSPWLIREIIKPIRKNVDSKGVRILEVGFGPGTVTREIIATAFRHDKDHLDAIELVTSLYKTAQNNIPKKENVHLFNANFAEWLPQDVNDLNEITSDFQYDFIVTTLPFTQLPIHVLKPILERISKLLKPGGTFTYISLIGADFLSNLLSCGIKNAHHYKKKMETFSEWEKSNFYLIDEVKHVESRSKEKAILLNISPAWVVHLIKK